ATVICALGNLANGSSATVTIDVKPSAPATVTNTASVTASVPDSNTANNSATLNTTIQPGNPKTGASFVVLLGGINSHQFSGEKGSDVQDDFKDISKALGKNTIYF